MKYISEYIKKALADGQYFFTKAEVLSSLNLSSEQFRHQAYRLMLKNDIRSLTRDSFMIIPAGYQNFGGVPPHWIIDPLMKHLNQNYYIGLLSAASMYGAAEQQPMIFQVITTKVRRPIELARGWIEFHVFKECNLSAVEQIASQAGYAQISSKEQTILDLIRFYPVCGYLSNVATVIKELCENCDVAKFKMILKVEKNISLLQRLGFIFEYIGYEKLALIIEKELTARATQFILLRPDVKSREGERHQRFKIILNDTLEIEE